jgi:hypothetical protein
MNKLFLVSTCLVALGGCGKAADKTVTVRDPGTGEKVDISVNDVGKGNMTIKTDKGSMVINAGADAKVPEGFETYPGAAVKSSITGFGSENGVTQAGGMVSMTTKDAPATVLAYYRGKFASKGWKIKMETTTPQGGMISAGGEDDKSGAFVTATAVNGETNVSVMMGK